MPDSLAFVDALPLIDHHCHGVRTDPLDRAAVERLLTEADTPGAPGTTLFDSQVGLAVRRWCAPVLDLPPHATPERYLARRAELPPDELTRRFLGGTRIVEYCVDTGFATDDLTTPSELAVLGEARAYEIVRLERVAEEVADTGGGTAAGFAAAVRERLAARARRAVGFKSIAAYRTGLALGAERPDDTEIAKAAERLFADAEVRGGARVADEVLHRFLVWTALDLGLPVQFHAGYGDRDIDLHRADPLLLTDLLRATEPLGVPVMLLHNYPYHRGAGYLAQVFSHVYIDVGLATHGIGLRASAVIAEALELTPFTKFCFSTDAYGLPELYYLGTLLFRRGLSDVLRVGLDDNVWRYDDAIRIAGLIGAGNARRAYHLPA
ncbi:MAG TPA: amidohydrolase family protein [Streptosporangiaceae bacterium]|jgi:hypothetical protein